MDSEPPAEPDEDDAVICGHCEAPITGGACCLLSDAGMLLCEACAAEAGDAG